jgi:hypothetical protein
MSHTVGHGENRQWWIYSNTFKCLPLSLIDFHSKSDFDRKSSSTQFERKWQDVMDIAESWV